MSERQIAITVGVSRSTVGEYLRRAAVIGITWPVPTGMDDVELERRLFTPPTFDENPARPLPDWTHVHRELKRPGVTLLLLWEEYRAEHAEGYGYSRFCDLNRRWRATVSPTMRQAHEPAEKLFVDFAGDTVAVFDAATGGQRLAHVFVAVLGASNYTYAEARWSEGLADWIGLHFNTFTAIGGVPKAVVCDNLKAGVTATCRYEPGINRTYQELAEHYGTAVLPTRPRKPRDKAKVEVAVQIVQRFVLARLRNRRFFSLIELNAAIRQTVADLNTKIMRKLGVSRNKRIAEIGQTTLDAILCAPHVYIATLLPYEQCTKKAKRTLSNGNLIRSCLLFPETLARSSRMRPNRPTLSKAFDSQFWADPDDWPHDPPGYVFLARALDKIARARWTDEWAETVIAVNGPIEPDDDCTDEISDQYDSDDDRYEQALEDAKAVVRARQETVAAELAKAFESGTVTTALRAKAGGKMNPLDAHFWNMEDFAGRFFYCEMSLDDPFATPFRFNQNRWNYVRQQSRHWIYVTQESLEKYLEQMTGGMVAPVAPSQDGRAQPNLPNTKPRRGRPPGSGSYRKADAPLIHEMRRLILSEEVPNATAAALHVGSQAKGTGLLDSTLARLRKGYKKQFPTGAK